MSYQALYRRYRPALFSDFVGQDAIIRTLRNQVMSGRIAHAYLFCGTRGTGKTSAAKVFARAINCTQPQDGEPCGTCDVCRALLQGNNLDILEIDAASNNGVDSIRNLQDEVQYPPLTARYRVYIVDEVHMLSLSAFNALLKTLEEPPPHIVFILATTAPEKLPATILSRCQRYDFRRIGADQIANRMRVALRDAHLTAEGAALMRIARAADGAMRDAWSILDMCLGYVQEDGNVTLELVTQVLGAADRETLMRFGDALISADAQCVLSIIRDSLYRGIEEQSFAKDVSAHLRSLLLADICGGEQAAQLLEITREDADEYVRQASRTSRTRLLHMLDLFLACESDMKLTAHPVFALEAAALRACAPEESLQLDALVMRVDELERKQREGTNPAAPTAPAAQQDAQLQELMRRVDELERRQREGTNPAAPTAPTVQEAVSGTARERSAAQAQMDAAPARETPSAKAKDKKKDAPDTFKEAARVWEETVRRLKKNPSFFGLAKQGRLASCAGGTYTVVFPKATGATNVQILNDEEHAALIGGLLTQIAGTPCTFRAAIEGTVPEQDAAVLAAQEQEKAQTKARFDMLDDSFGRENVRVTGDA